MSIVETKDCEKDFKMVPRFGFTLSRRGLEFFRHYSKTPQDIEKKLSDFDSTPSRVILHILSITIVIRCSHGNLLFSICHIIFWDEKIKRLNLFFKIMA